MDGLPILVAARLAGFRHGFTMRQGGASEGPFATLNLGGAVGDDPARVEENWARLERATGLLAEERREQLPRTVPILNVRGQHHHHQDQTQRVHQQMALATVDLFARIVAAHAWNRSGLDALAVQTAGCRVFVATMPPAQ